MRVFHTDPVFECIAHNLLLLFEQRMIHQEGMRDEVETKRQFGRVPAKAADTATIKAVRNFINSAITRATQRTQRFIRWVRVRMYQEAPWSQSLARLRELWLLPT